MSEEFSGEQTNAHIRYNPVDGTNGDHISAHPPLIEDTDTVILGEDERRAIANAVEMQRLEWQQSIPNLINRLRDEEQSPLVMKELFSQWGEMPSAKRLTEVMMCAGKKLAERNERNGGHMVELNPEIPTVVVRDLHAEKELLENILGEVRDFDGSSMTILEAVRQGKLNLVFVGDISHIEGLPSYVSANYPTKSAADSNEIYKNTNIAKSTNASMITALLEYAYDNVTVLRGNHEDIFGSNVFDGSNSLRKGGVNMTESTKIAMNDVYGDESSRLMNLIDFYEERMPLVAYCKNKINPFLVSHSPFDKELTPADLDNPTRETIISTTWTDNTTDRYAPLSEGEAQLVQRTYDTAKNFGIQRGSRLLHFFGHRPVEKGKRDRLHIRRKDNTAVMLYQIHRGPFEAHNGIDVSGNEHRYAWIPVDRPFDSSKDILDANPNNMFIDPFADQGNATLNP